MPSIFNPKVSVIMNCLNSEDYMRAAIESIYSQTYNNWEIILFDNASTDTTAEIAMSFDSKLCYFRNDKTVPLGEARNLALKQAEGEFIAFLDSDDVWYAEKLEKQIPLFDAAPSIGLVFSNTHLTNKEHKNSTDKFSENNFKSLKGNMFLQLLQNYSIPMLTVIIRKEVLHNLDEWFDNTFQCCDDYDFIMRIVYEWECDYINEPLANCLIHNDAVTVKFHQYAASERLKTLVKLSDKHPGFSSQYKNEIFKLQQNITYVQGVSYWRNGNGIAARKEFKKYIIRFKFFLSFLLTLIPFSWVEKVSNTIKNLHLFNFIKNNFQESREK